MKERQEELRKITKSLANQSELKNNYQSSISINPQYASQNTTSRSIQSQNQLYRLKNFKSNSSFIQNDSFNFHNPSHSMNPILQYKQLTQQQFKNKHITTKFSQDHYANSSLQGFSSQLQNQNQSIRKTNTSQSQYVSGLQSNPTSPQNQNMGSTGFSFSTNPWTPHQKAQDCNMDAIINHIPKLNLSKPPSNNYSTSKSNKSFQIGTIVNQQQNYMMQSNSQNINKQQTQSSKQSPLRQFQDNQNIKFKSLSQQKTAYAQIRNQSQHQISKSQQFQKFSINQLKRQQEYPKKGQSNQQKNKQLSLMNANELAQINSSLISSNGFVENSGQVLNGTMFNQVAQQQLQLGINNPSNQNNIQNNLQNTAMKESRLLQKRDSENDLFSTTRKEHRMVELMKQKIHQNSLMDYYIPKQEKLITRISYLTSKLNPYYEKTMNLVNDIENKKLQFGDESKLNNELSSQCISSQMSPQINQYISGCNESNDVDGYYNYIDLKNHQAQSLELIYKQNCQNIIHAETLEFFYVHVCVKAMPTPIRVCFKTPISKLKVFISKSAPYPSKFQNDYILQSNIARVDDGSNKQFSFDKLYFGILSEIEQEIRITIKFGMEKKVAPVLTSFKPGEYSDFYNQGYSRSSYKQKRRHISTPVLAQDVAEIKQRRRMKLLKYTKDGVEKDFQQENIKKVACYSPDSHKNQFQEKQFQFNSKHKEVIEKKKLLDEQQYYKKEYLIKCRDLQKQINHTYFAITEKRREIIKFSNTWAKMILQLMGIQFLFKKIKRKSNMMRTLRDATFRLKIMINNIQRRVKNSGIKSINQRALLDVQGSIHLFACKIKKQAKKRAGELIMNTLLKRKEFYSFHIHITSYFNTINMIINRWREFRTKKENFQRMLGFLFDKYFSKVLETISKSGSDANDFFTIIKNARRIDKVKTDFNKLKKSYQQRTTRKKFIECYLDRRRVEYTQDLFKYFQIKQKHSKLLYLQALIKKRKDEEIDFNENKFDEVNEDREQEIEKLLFDQVIDKKRAESLNPPRFFIVPTYEVLKQVVCETFVKVKDEQIVKKLREEKIKKNWTEQIFFQKLIQNDDVVYFFNIEIKFICLFIIKQYSKIKRILLRSKNNESNCIERQEQKMKNDLQIQLKLKEIIQKWQTWWQILSILNIKIQFNLKIIYYQKILADNTCTYLKSLYFNIFLMKFHLQTFQLINLFLSY